VVRIEAYAFWQTLVFILNGVVFLLIGLQLPYIRAGIQTFGLGDLLLQGALFSVAVILLRLIWIYPGAYVSYLIRRKLLGQPEKTPSPRALFIVGWTGMRGVVALAAAMSLPSTLSNGMPFPQRDVIIFLTFCVIFATLVLQGLTLPALVRRLHVAGQPFEKCEEIEARGIMNEAALRNLEKRPDRDNPEMKAVYDDVISHYRLRRAALERAHDGDRVSSLQQDPFEKLTRELRDAERAAAVQLRDQDRISDEVLRGLLRELDLLDARPSAPEPEENADSH
jgi:CPA1 family monovalent cation:H+ antiporter